MDTSIFYLSLAVGIGILAATQAYTRKNQYLIAKFLGFTILPAVIGLILFVLNFSSWINFFSILLAFWVVNFLHNVTLHRWLAHEQFEPKSFVRPLLLYNLTLVGCYSPLRWVDAHKSHHFNPDSEFDPYPPSIGLWRLLVGPYQRNKNYQLTNELQKKDIQFIGKYYFWIYIANLVLFFSIDPNIVFLSFAFLKLYTFINHAFQNWLLHGGARDGKPSNISAVYDIIFSADGLHKNHHEKPFVFNYGFTQRQDWFYFVLQFLAKKKIIK